MEKSGMEEEKEGGSRNPWNKKWRESKRRGRRMKRKKK
jgi:hypothetical protein